MNVCNGTYQMKQYVVQKGDSLYMIAKKFNVSVDDLKKHNHLYSNMIYPNQILLIPTTTDAKKTYMTSDGESLKDILKKFNINVSDLEAYNNIDELRLMGNQLLMVEKNNNNSYVVSEYDTIDGILAKFGLTPIEFLNLNKGKILIPGTEVIIRK